MEERRRSILAELQRNGRVEVKALSGQLKVSTVTIRQDLRALAQAKLIERTHGGAVLPSTRATSPEMSFELRLRENQRGKSQIARRAAQYIRPGDSIALDASTTAFAMLPCLKQIERLTIITNSLVITQNLLDSPHIQVLMPSGRLRRDSVSLVGMPECLPQLHLSAAFISAHGYASTAGFTESSREEAQMKQAMLQQCRSTYVLFDHQKWGKIAPFTLLHPQEADLILTSRQTPPHWLDLLDRHGGAIEFAD